MTLMALLMIAVVGYAAQYGSTANHEAVSWLGAIGFTLICLPLIKAGDIKLRLGLLGILPEFMSMVFADQPFPRWLAARFGKSVTKDS